MNYKIIMDEQKLRDFIEWLPELRENEKYYLCLFARSKYTKDAEGNNGIAHIKSDKAQLKRFVSDKERMFGKIQQLECKLGSYYQRDVPIPQESLALYITPNPRNMYKATINTMVKLAKSIRDSNVTMNPHQEALSEIQKSKGVTHYVDFDFDLAEGPLLDVMENIEARLGKKCLTWIKTRGGAHCLVRPDLVDVDYNNKWYNLCKSYSDQCGDTMIPVVGTYQGGFIPHFTTLEHEQSIYRAGTQQLQQS